MSKIQNSFNIYPCIWRRLTCPTQDFGNLYYSVALWRHGRSAWHNCLLLTTATVYPKKYAHGFCFAVLCCGYTLTDFTISIRLTSLASKATLMNMDKYFMWIHYERLYNHNKAKHNKTVCIFLGIYCSNVNCWADVANHVTWLWQSGDTYSFERWITG